MYNIKIKKRNKNDFNETNYFIKMEIRKEIRDERKEIRDERKERKEIREKIKSPAKDLCTHVVNTCIEYKEELLNLEKDNLKLERKNKNLKNKIESLEEQNALLLEELMESQERIRKMIERFDSKNMCYNCDHFLHCGETFLCIYCKEWVCVCCINYCKEELGLNKYGETVYCNISICESCYNTHEKCPDHLDLNKELCIELHEYFNKNRYKKYGF